MFVRQSFNTILLLLFTAVLSNAQTTIQEDIEHLNRQMEDAFNKGDLQAVASFYLDEAHLLSPSNEISGKKEIKNYWMSIKNPVSWKLEVVEVSQNESDIYDEQFYKALKNKPPGWRAAGIELDDDYEYIYELGHSTLKVKDANGKIKSSDVDFILIWRVMTDGSYKIILDTYTWN